MASVSTYLNFPRETAEAFDFYRGVFGTDYLGPPMRYRDMPSGGGEPAIREEDLDLIINVQLPITGGHILMGADAPESMGWTRTACNSITLNLRPDTRAEADRLFASLSEGGTVGMPMADMFWGDYWGSLTDRYGIQWMIGCSSAE